MNELTFAKKLKIKRAELGITQDELAKKSGISVAQIRRYETSKEFEVKPNYQTIMALAKALETDEKELAELAGYINGKENTSQEKQPTNTTERPRKVYTSDPNLKIKSTYAEEPPAFSPDMFLPISYNQVKQIIEETVDKASKAVDLKYKQMGLENSLPGTMNISEPYKNKVPLISGSAACGQPFTLTDNIIEDYVSHPDEIKPDFAITARGNSMLELGIVSGTICFIRKQAEVNSGDIAAICFYNGGEVYPVLKVAKRNNGGYHFYDGRGEEVTFDGEYEIIGKVVGMLTLPGERSR